MRNINGNGEKNVNFNLTTFRILNSRDEFKDKDRDLLSLPPWLLGQGVALECIIFFSFCSCTYSPSFCPPYNFLLSFIYYFYAVSSKPPASALPLVLNFQLLSGNLLTNITLTS